MSLNSLEGYCLSPQQAHLWALQQQHPTLPQQARVTVACEGKLQISALVQAMKQVGQRHEILRTTFQQLPGMTLPLQVISEEGIVDIKVVGAGSGKLATHPPAQSPWRATIEVLSKEKALLHLTLPTLCADATTLTLLSQAIAQEYGVVLGQVSEESEPMQYADLAAWQNELLESEDTRTGREYWQKCVPPEAVLRLPFEFDLPETPPFQPACLNHSLTDSQSEQLTALSQAQQVSLSSILLALWKIVLFRLAQPQRLTVSITTNGRHYAELENALGLLAKSLPLTTDWHPDLSCCEFFQEIERSRLEASQWQDYFSGTPTPVPVGFELVTGFSALTYARVTFSVQQRWLDLEPFPLKLTVIQDSLELEFHYNANRFEPAAIAQMAMTFQTALEAVLAAPNTPISRLNLVSQRERQRLLAAHPPSPAPSDDCLHHWVEAQAQRHPNARAVVFEHSLTYAELNARANQLAHVLQQWGVSPETPVALYIERSAAAIVGLVGILKAGGAYVPIDPGLPLSGVEFRLHNTGATVVVTQSNLAQSLSGSAVTSAKILCLDADWTEIRQAPATNPDSTVNADNLAYILFTSGSTGTPKGVAIAHRQLTSYVHSILPQLALSDDSKANFALVSTLAADLGNTTLFASLCTGGCLHVISRERALDPEALADYCQANPIDYLKIVPSHLKVLLNGSRPHTILPRQLILGGEVSHWDELARLQQLQPHCAILNHYGPTETTVGAIAYAVRGREAALDSQTVPLGFPLANARIYLLDEALQPVPTGAAGEIYIGGAGVGRGYWQRSGLTAEVFLPDPFSEEAGARFYKTGDRARFRLDGTLEFLGRVDSQVKIRGYRVELGEIEATLRQHPNLQTAVVLYRESEGQLVAYGVAHHSPPPSVADIRQFLQERLLEAVIPPAIAVLDTMPLLPNGKIDRQALLKMELAPPPSSRQFVAPRSPVEVALAQLWSQVLGVERVGLHDSFFELGGDSILCIQVVARATQAGLRFTPKQLFEHPTVAELAPLVNTTQTPPAAQTAVVGSVPLTPIQQWFFEQAFADAHHWNQSVLLQSPHRLAPAILKQAVHHLIEHHDALRLRFQQGATGWQQWNAQVPSDPPFLHIDLSALPKSAQTSALEATATALQASLELESLLLRVVLFELDGSCRLLILAHHLVTDGVSWRILLADLQQIYQQLQQGQAVQLPPKTTAFKTWAERLQVYADSEQLQAQLDYWRTAATASTIVFPVDFPEVENRVAEARSLSISLSPQETAALLQEVPAAYHTQIDEILLTALAMAVLDPEYSPIACQPHSEAVLRVDLEGHGRETLFEEIDLSRTVGWFTTIFPVVLSLKPGDRLGDTIKSIKEQLRRVPQQGIGYGVLRYLGAEGHQLSSASTAQIRFNYLGQIDTAFAEAAWLSPAADPGLGRSPRGLRPYLLDMSGWISKRQLTWRWDYSAAMHQETVAQLADGYLRALRSLVHHCQSPEASAYTPSDFPDAALDQTDLDELLGQLG